MQTSTWSAGFFDISDSHIQIASNFDSNMYLYDYPGSPSAPPLTVAPSYPPLSEPENETLSAAYAGAVSSSTDQPLYDTASNSAADDAYKLIPQVPFAYRTTFSAGRYPRDFEPHNVAFQMQGATQPGVTLSAIGSGSHGLVDADRPVFCADMANVITLCLQIPGCAAYRPRIHTWSKDRTARITVEDLARQLARRLYCFFKKPLAREWLRRQPISDISHQIVLVNFYRVTRGTWQVDLGLSRLPIVH